MPQLLASKVNFFCIKESITVSYTNFPLNHNQIPNQTRIIYADDEQKQEFERKGHYKRMRGAKVVPKPVDCRKLMDKFDFKLRNSLVIRLNNKHTFRININSFIRFLAPQ
jgi:hypothetical protein